MKIKEFEEIISWNMSQDLATEIYSLFRNMDDFGFRNQICRAAVSISNNITEGYDRSSDKDFKRFLYIALSSCSEVKSMLYLAERLKYLSPNQSENLRIKCKEISKTINGLIRVLG